MVLKHSRCVQAVLARVWGVLAAPNRPQGPRGNAVQASHHTLIHRNPLAADR